MNKLAEDKKEVSYEENVITPEEFSELEKKETKKIKLKKAEKPEASAARPEKATEVDMLLLKTEKLEGKIEAMADFRRAVDERISGLNQEIGELRSSILEKDKTVREFQQGFAKIRDMAEAIEPQKIVTQFAQKDEEIEKLDAQLENLATQLKQLRVSVKDNTDILENIKDIKNLLNIINTLKDKVGKVEEHRKYTTRTAGKIEAMFAELSGKLAEFQGYKDKIAFNEETMHEIMKAVDILETRLQESARKDDLKKLEDSVDDKLEKTSTEVDDKLFDLRKLFDELLEDLKEAGIKSVLEKVGRSGLEKSFASRDDLEELRQRLDSLREASARVAAEKEREFAQERPRRMPKAPAREAPGPIIREAETRKPESMPGAPEPEQAPEEIVLPIEEQPRPGPAADINEAIDSLIDQAEEAIRMGNLDVAKNRYREALSLYSQLNESESYEQAAAIYDKIKRLYSRLRIYS